MFYLITTARRLKRVIWNATRRHIECRKLLVIICNELIARHVIEPLAVDAVRLRRISLCDDEWGLSFGNIPYVGRWRLLFIRLLPSKPVHFPTGYEVRHCLTTIQRRHKPRLVVDEIRSADLVSVLEDQEPFCVKSYDAGFVGLECSLQAASESARHGGNGQSSSVVALSPFLPELRRLEGHKRGCPSDAKVAAVWQQSDADVKRAKQICWSLATCRTIVENVGNRLMNGLRVEVARHIRDLSAEMIANCANKKQP